MNEAKANNITLPDNSTLYATHDSPSGKSMENNQDSANVNNYKVNTTQDSFTSGNAMPFKSPYKYNLEGKHETINKPATTESKKEQKIPIAVDCSSCNGKIIKRNEERQSPNSFIRSIRALSPFRSRVSSKNIINKSSQIDENKYQTVDSTTDSNVMKISTNSQPKLYVDSGSIHKIDKFKSGKFN